MSRFINCVLFIVVAGLISTTTLQAAITDRYWNNTGTTGDFNDGANWDIDNPPVDPFTGPLVTGDTAYINDGGTANISADVTVILQSLYLGQGTGSSGTVHQTAGAITINAGIQGMGTGGGTGSYIMDGGTLTMQGLGANGLQYPNYTTPSWMIGTGAGSNGSVTMRNSATVNATGQTRIGDTGGTGSFEMYNSSTYNQCGHFLISQGASGNGTLTLHDSATINVTNSSLNPVITPSTYYGGLTVIGQSGSTGVMNILDSAKFNAGDNFYVGRLQATGTLNMNSTSTSDRAQPAFRNVSASSASTYVRAAA